MILLRHSPLPIHSRLQGALRTRIDRVERCRTADIKSIALLIAETQIGDGFRYVDLAEQLAVGGVAAHAVLVRIAPTHGAPYAPLGVTAHAVGNAGLGHVRKDLVVPQFSHLNVQVEDADM